MVVRSILALAAILAVAGQPALAQESFGGIDTSGITGATIVQYDRFDPRDMVESEDGHFTPKPNARIVRPARRCRLDTWTAQEAARTMGHARISAEQWEGLSGDMVIRFDGADGEDGQLVAVVEGIKDASPPAEIRVFYAGIAAFLGKQDHAVISRIGKDVGCPFDLTLPSGR